MRRIPEEFGRMLNVVEVFVVLLLMGILTLAGVFIVSSFKGTLW